MHEGRGVRKAFTLAGCLILSLALAVPALAQDMKPWADFSVFGGTKYVWRGFEASRNSFVVQPSFTVGYYGFYANAWGNIDTDPWLPGDAPPEVVDENEKKWNETRLTMAYGNQFGPIIFELGYIYYAYDGAKDTQEAYVSVGVDIPLKPTFTAYRDFDNYEAWYIKFEVSHSFKITENVSIDLMAYWSWLESDDEVVYPEFDQNLVATGEKFSNFHDGVVSLSIPFTFGYFYVTPMVAYSYPITDDAKYQIKAFSFNGDEQAWVYGGLTVGFRF